MKMQLACGCCEKNCYKRYSPPGRDSYYMQAQRTPLGVSVADNRAAGIAYLPPLPADWSPDARSVDPVLPGPHGQDPHNYFNQNPDYFGRPLVTMNMVPHSYTYRNMLNEHTFWPMKHSRVSTGDPWFSRDDRERPECRLSAYSRIKTSYGIGPLVGSAAVPADVTITFPKVPLTIIPNQSLIADTKHSDGNWMHYYNSTVGKDPISYFDVPVSEFEFEPSDATVGTFLPATNVYYTGGVFASGLRMSAGVDERHYLELKNGRYHYTVNATGGEGSGAIVYLRHHTTLSTTATESYIPKVTMSGPPETDFHVTFRRSMPIGVYNADPAGADALRLGQSMLGPLAYDESPTWRQPLSGRLPIFLGDVAIAMSFEDVTGLGYGGLGSHSRLNSNLSMAAEYRSPEGEEIPWRETTYRDVLTTTLHRTSSSSGLSIDDTITVDRHNNAPPRTFYPPPY